MCQCPLLHVNVVSYKKHKSDDPGFSQPVSSTFDIESAQV